MSSRPFKDALINENFCFLARRERFLSGEIYEHISSIKKREQGRQGAKRPLISASLNRVGSILAPDTQRSAAMYLEGILVRG